MKHLARLAASYLRQAGDRLDDARRALRRGNYPYALRLSQECVELSLKAALRLVGIEYPKVHDVSDILLENSGRFPDFFRDNLEFLADASRRLSSKRDISFYGGEEALLPPEELVSRKDAEEAVEMADKTLTLCKRLMGELAKT